MVVGHPANVAGSAQPGREEGEPPHRAGRLATPVIARRPLASSRRAAAIVRHFEKLWPVDRPRLRQTTRLAVPRGAADRRHRRLVRAQLQHPTRNALAAAAPLPQLPSPASLCPLGKLSLLTQDTLPASPRQLPLKTQCQHRGTPEKAGARGVRERQRAQEVVSTGEPLGIRAGSY